MNNDTILLLKECDSGLKMAISSLDEVLDVIKNQKFKEICITSKNKHQTLKTSSSRKRTFITRKKHVMAKNEF